MGLDLSLLPIESEQGAWGYSHTILNCERRSELFEEILKVEREGGQYVPDKFKSYLSREPDGAETHYGLTVKTPYGERLLCVTARDLLTVKDHEGVRDNGLNRAVWAYLTELDPTTKVALYWH